MASKTQGLKLELREKSGSTGARNERQNGRIPGVLYGHGKAPVAIAVDAKAFGELLHGKRSTIVDVTLDGTKDTAIIRDMQLDPVTRRVMSIDFQRVSRTDVITAEVPIITVGTPAGVREQGGVMDVVTHELEVRGPADQIPESFRVDVSELTIGHHINAGDIPLPAGFRLVTAPDQTIVSIEAPRVEEEVVADLTQVTPEAVVPVEGEEPPAETGTTTQ
jgi:large subunit ribosomal protein L25